MKKKSDVKDALVTKDNYPLVFEALETISHDRGAGAGHSNYALPPRWLGRLGKIEQSLTTLTKEERETFAIGEDSEVKAIADRSAALHEAHELLDAFFDDFEGEENPKEDDKPSDDN